MDLNKKLRECPVKTPDQIRFFNSGVIWRSPLPLCHLNIFLNLYFDDVSHSIYVFITNDEDQIIYKHNDVYTHPTIIYLIDGNSAYIHRVGLNHAAAVARVVSREEGHKYDAYCLGFKIESIIE